MNTQLNWQNIHLWCKKLHDRSNSKARAERAQLRHCKSLAHIMLHPAYVNLLQQIGANTIDNAFLPVITSILAHINYSENYIENGNRPTFARRMAQNESGTNQPLISPIRFRQLLACTDAEKLHRLLIRTVKQVEFFDIERFAKNVFDWNNKKGLTIKKKWAWDYYTTLSE